MNIYYSPISRHIIYNYNHYLIFIIHDISSILTIILFFILSNIPKTRIHKNIGKFSIFPLTITIISGFSLISNKINNNNISNEVLNIYSITLFTQGLNIINISLNAFFINKIIKNNYLIFTLVYLHIIDLYYGIKSLFILLNTIYYSKNILWIELSFELLFILTVPQLLNEIYYIYIHYQYFIKNYQNFVFKKHHHLSIIFLINMSLPSILYSISHDKYWLKINSYITNFFTRILIMVFPLILNLFYNRTTFFKLME